MLPWTRRTGLPSSGPLTQQLVTIRSVSIVILSIALASLVSGFQEVDDLLLAVPDNGRHGRLGPCHHPARPQHQLAGRDEADGVDLGRRREGDEARPGPAREAGGLAP